MIKTQKIFKLFKTKRISKLPGFLIWGAFFLCLSGVVILVSHLISMRWLKVKKVSVYSKKLKPSDPPVRFLHISDLHSNSETKMNLDIWQKIDKLSFDIVVITGDLIMNKVNELSAHLPYLKRLAERVPVFFTDGNHEAYVHDKIKNVLEEIGVTVLYNEKKAVTIRGLQLNIIGTKDYKRLVAEDFCGLPELFSNTSHRLTVVLTHQPQLFDKIKSYSPDLVLSGHTHGGQIRIPFLPTLFAPWQGFLPKYGDGLYFDRGSVLYVSKGIGTTVFPLRLFNRAEIGLIEVLKL